MAASLPSISICYVQGFRVLDFEQLVCCVNSTTALSGFHLSFMKNKPSKPKNHSNKDLKTSYVILQGELLSRNTSVH